MIVAFYRDEPEHQVALNAQQQEKIRLQCHALDGVKHGGRIDMLQHPDERRCGRHQGGKMTMAAQVHGQPEAAQIDENGAESMDQEVYRLESSRIVRLGSGL